jgi:hypothetical protein
MKTDWIIGLAISIVAFTVAPIKRSHREESIFRNQMVGNGYWGRGIGGQDCAPGPWARSSIRYTRRISGASLNRFRPGRSQHQELDALYVVITRKKVNRVLDCDICSASRLLCEGEGGYFRRNHLVPIPKVSRSSGDEQTSAGGMQRGCQASNPGTDRDSGRVARREREHLAPLPKERFEPAEVSFPEVDSGGCVVVQTNRYSTPLRPGTRVEAKLYPAHVELWKDGQRIAHHERRYRRRQQILELEHYWSR